MEWQQLEEHVDFRGLQATRTATWRYLVGVVSRWVVTLLLSLAIWQVLWFYSVTLVIMGDDTKREFNVWITGLTIALGLSLASSLDKLAKDLRWWILSRRYRSRRKVEVILQSDNILAVLRMALASRRWTIHATAISWLLVLMASQIGLAILGLFYSVDASSQLALIVKPGNVSIPNMSTVQPIGITASNSTSTSDEEYASNIYGAMSLIYPTGIRGQEPMIGDLRLASDPVIFCDNQGCDFVFLEASVSADPDVQLADLSSWQPMIVATNRKIGISTTCSSYPVINGGNGTAAEITYRQAKNKAANKQGEVHVPVPMAGGTAKTMFMTDTSINCGPGCRAVTALETSTDDPWFYSCNTTVGTVANATMAEHHVSEHVRFLAAQAIALKGYRISSSADDIFLNKQHQVYPAQSAFGTPLAGRSEALAVSMSRFAAGVIAMVAKTNEQISVTGFPPMQGSTLTVDRWDYVGLILTTVVWLQLVLSIAVAIMATRVVIPPDGARSMAKVLRVMAADGNPAGSQWIYRSQKVFKDGVYDLYIDRCPRGQPERAHTN
ncbi:hypothetical protein Focb16_v015431 [Fusarium oxysporum f. sp. cubense]|uniref:Uncharacterized protein n=1 Tax=Fusarium oxysporum f. sp. cubense TaxID=61366 RepID=A0A559KXT3_FUSOC|nr:hypothetical protein Focb16_v015431 [Fusarium oxysporum f. sp. cubense]